ncbi:MAG: GTPase HflX, partial [Oscillospiraceae bacterium]|nr:GTPase HflX [Oscillospiraceae bacterium]
PRIEAFNKCDVLSDDARPHGEHSVEISAKTGAGISTLLEKIDEIFAKAKKKVTLRIPYDKGALVETLHRESAVKAMRYLEDCVELDAVISADMYGRLKEFIWTESEDNGK